MECHWSIQRISHSLYWFLHTLIENCLIIKINKWVISSVGWADVPLTDRGRNQAVAAGRCLAKFNIVPDAVFTSLLSRSKDSYKEILKVNPTWQTVPVISSWRLNERHYGGLVGLSKEEAGRKLGAEKVMDWRRLTSFFLYNSILQENMAIIYIQPF